MEINYPKTLVIQDSKGDTTFYFAEFDIEEDKWEYIIVAEKYPSRKIFEHIEAKPYADRIKYGWIRVWVAALNAIEGFMDNMTGNAIRFKSESEADKALTEKILPHLMKLLKTLEKSLDLRIEIVGL